MALFLGSEPVVDVASVTQDYQERLTELGLLDQCNLQHFRNIDGAGQGHFLMHSVQLGQATTSSAVTIKWTDQLSNSFATPSGGQVPTVEQHDIWIRKILKLAPKAQTSDYLVLICTEEYKGKFHSEVVTKSYNIIDREKSEVQDDGTFVKQYKNPMAPQTLEEILQDLWSGGTVNLSIDSSTVPTSLYPDDVLTQGMSKLEAMDYICKPHALLWTATRSGSVDNIYVAGAPSPLQEPFELADIKSVNTQPAIRKYIFRTPLFFSGGADDRGAEEQFYYKDVTGLATEEGEEYSFYYPFAYATLDSNGEFGTTSDPDDAQANLNVNYDAMARLIQNYFEQRTVNTLISNSGPSKIALTDLNCIEMYFGDDGVPKRIETSPYYPFVPLPKPHPPGAPEQEIFFYFKLLEDPSPEPPDPFVVAADIFDARDQTTQIESNVPLTCNANPMFIDLKSGDGGTCNKSKGDYFAVNAPCEIEEEGGPVFPTPSGP